MKRRLREGRGKKGGRKEEGRLEERKRAERKEEGRTEGSPAGGDKRSAYGLRVPLLLGSRTQYNRK